MNGIKRQRSIQLDSQLKIQLAVILGVFFLFGGWTIAQAQDVPPQETPVPAQPAEPLQATIEAQAERLTELESQWAAVQQQNSFALDQNIFNFVTRPAIYIGAILTALGILLIWRSTSEVTGRLQRWENNIQRTLTHFDREQSLKQETYQQQLTIQINEQIQTLQIENTERENQLHREIQQALRQVQNIDPQILIRAQRLLDTIMIPIRLPRGYNLGQIYERLQLCGFENLCWYDNLGERPTPGITLILIRSNDDISRFLSQIQRFDPAPRPRETAFILFAANPNLQIGLIEDMYIAFPNIALARTPLEIATQVMTVARGLQPDTTSRHDPTTVQA